MPAHVVEKNAVFVPAGWDNEKKLDIIKETISDIEQPLEVVLFFIKMKVIPIQNAVSCFFFHLNF